MEIFNDTLQKFVEKFQYVKKKNNNKNKIIDNY